MATKETRGIGPVPDALEKIDPDGWLTQLRRYILDLQFGRVAALAGTTTTSGATTAPSPTPGPPGPPGPPAGPDTPDLTPPPTPSGGNVLAGLDFIGITTDPPTFTMGHGYKRTLVYGATYSGTGPLPTFGSAVLVHEFVGQVGAFPSEPKTEWHIWLTWLTNDGVESVTPAGGTNGFTGTTGTDPTKLLEALTGVITETQLYADLGARINLIDGPSTLAGSVAKRILDEATARGTAIASEASARTTADAAITARTDTLSAVFQVGALNADPGMFSPSEFWTFEAGSVTRVTGSSATRFAFRSTAQANYFDKRRIPFDPSKTYRMSARARSSTGVVGLDGALYLVIQAYDAAGNPVAQWGGGGSYSFYPVAGAVPPTGWTDYAASFSASGNGFPGTVTSISVGVIQSYVASGGWMEVEQVRLIDDTSTAVAAGLSAAIATEQTARASGDTALASQITALSSTVTTNNTAALAAIASEASTRASADGAISTSLNNLIASYNSTTASTSAAIVAEQTARANGDAANASSITTLQSRIDAPSGGVNRLTNPTFGAVAAVSLASWNTYNNDGAGAPTTISGVAGADGFNAIEVQWSGTNASTKGIYQVPIGTAMKAGQWYILACKVMAPPGSSMLGKKVTMAATNTPWTTYTSLVDPVLTSEYQWYIARAKPSADSTELFITHDGGGAVADGLYRISQPIIHEGYEFKGFNEGSLVASVQQEATTRASVDNGLLAQWTVKLDVNGYVSGFGLASTSNGAAPTSTFIVRSDSFAISSPSGPGITPIIPFAVQTTPITTAAGEVLPVGVYMDAAYVRNLDAALGRFSNAIITNALIVSLSASKITAGSLSVGEYIQSSAFVPGTTAGFRIDGGGGVEIRNVGGTRIFNLNASGSAPVLKVGTAFEILANGNATYSGVLSAATGSFSGAVTATSGAIGGITIDATGIQSLGYTSGPGGSGFRLNSDGSAVLDAASIRGLITAGAVNAASGTLGTITAGLLRNAGSTIKMDLNAIGTQDVLNINNKVRITAAGEPYFTNSIVSGTWTGSFELIDTIVAEVTTYATPIKELLIDTGFNIPYQQFYERTLTARVGGLNISFTPGETSGNYVGSLDVSAEVASRIPLYSGSGGFTPGQNPYGTNNQRLFVRVRVQCSDRDGKTSLALTSLSWTVDTSG